MIPVRSPTGVLADGRYGLGAEAIRQGCWNLRCGGRCSRIENGARTERHRVELASSCTRDIPALREQLGRSRMAARQSSVSPPGRQQRLRSSAGNVCDRLASISCSSSARSRTRRRRHGAPPPTPMKLSGARRATRILTENNFESNINIRHKYLSAAIPVCIQVFVRFAPLRRKLVLGLCG